MAEYLFLVTIGPVQEFIAAARRSRDLWAGSQLLSDLSGAAAKLLRDEGANLIFPAQDDLGKHEVVNRILVSVPIPPAKLGPRLEQKLRETLRDQASVTLDHIPGFKQCDTLTYAKGQVDDLPEIFWAGVERTSNYKNDRAQLEGALAARKNTRDFFQPAYAAMVPKSSIDGVRESVIPEKFFAARSDNPAAQQQKIGRLFDLFGAGQAERLSGVDLLKRHFRGTAGQADFPSSSHFAALPWLQRHQQYTSAFDAYLKDVAYLRPEQLNRTRFAKLDLLQSYDASILFEERLAEATDEAERRTAQGRLQQLYAGIGSRPDPYYAILHADGDNMGKVIDHQAQGSGAQPNDSSRDLDGIARHKALSQALDDFASSVRPLIESEQHRGALVYSGGDDVLAFLPLDTALFCAQQLTASFAERLEGFEGEYGERPTLSVGIAVSHHIEPLAEALDLARKA